MKAIGAATLFWIVLAQGIGGSAPALTKLALEGLGPWTLVLVRQLLGAAFLFAMLRTSGPVVPRLRETARSFDRKEWLLLLTLAWAGFALPQILAALGLERSSATNGALLSPLEPIGILLGGALLLGERLYGARVLAMILGIGGATLIVMQGGVDPAAGDLFGDLLMAVGHLSWAIYTLAAKPLLARHEPGRLTLLGTILSPIPLVPLALAEPFDWNAALPAAGWVLLLAFLATALGTFAWNQALRSVTAGTMAVFIFLQPVCGLALGQMLGEPVGTLALAGAAIIVVGTILGTRPAPGASS